MREGFILKNFAETRNVLIIVKLLLIEKINALTEIMKATCTHIVWY
jgi:hypothetical protein